MINVTPNAVEVNAAFNLLTIFEIIKDPASLKASLEQIKQAQDAAAAERQAAEVVKAQADKAMQEVDNARALLASQEAQTREQAARASRQVEESEAVSRAAKREREAFDAWMAQRREELDNQTAKVRSDAEQNARALKAFSAKEEELTQRAENLARLEQVAEAKRAEFEAKLASLKAMVE
jgi:hypothetical protein